jgi:hypothetical protein
LNGMEKSQKYRRNSGTYAVMNKRRGWQLQPLNKTLALQSAPGHHLYTAGDRERNKGELETWINGENRRQEINRNTKRWRKKRNGTTFCTHNSFWVWVHSHCAEL